MNGTADERIRVLVIGESPVVRAGLEAALSDSHRFEVVGTCNLAGSAALFESTAAEAVLMESGAFRSWIPGEAVSENEPGPKPPSVSLTPREIEVLRLLADGATNKIIAHKLDYRSSDIYTIGTFLCENGLCRSRQSGRR